MGVDVMKGSMRKMLRRKEVQVAKISDYLLSLWMLLFAVSLAMSCM